MIARADIVAEAKRWLKTPWHHQASKRGVGSDCLGLARGVARELNIEGARELDASPEFSSYGREPTRGLLEAGCDRFLIRITLEQAQPGDLLLLNALQVHQPMHFAIISSLDPMYMIHAYAQRRMIVENRVDDEWRKRIVRVYRYRGID